MEIIIIYSTCLFLLIYLIIYYVRKARQNSYQNGMTPSQKIMIDEQERKQ